MHNMQELSAFDNVTNSVCFKLINESCTEDIQTGQKIS